MEFTVIPNEQTPKINVIQHELVGEYIKKHKEWHEEDKKLIERYSNFFKTLNSFLPKSNIRLG